MDFVKLETKLRTLLKTTALPPPITDIACCDVPEAVNANKANQTTKTIEADHTPALTFEGDNIVDDAVAQARARRLTVNCRVSASKELRGIRKGATGIVKKMEKDIHVLWDMGSRMDGSDKSVSSCELVPMTLSSIQWSAASETQTPVAKAAAALVSP